MLMHVLHKHAHQHPHLSFPTVNPEFTLGKPWVYPTQTPSLLRPIWKCINMQLVILGVSMEVSPTTVVKAPQPD